ncbi:glycerol-3-phosphate acyltransferase [Latilactobacillus sakei]
MPTLSFYALQVAKPLQPTAGILLAYNPLFFVIASTIFISVILITSMVSMASIIGPLLIAILSFYTHDWLLGTIATLVLIFLTYRHRENISRIKNGTENLVPFGLYYRYKQKNANKGVFLCDHLKIN